MQEGDDHLPPCQAQTSQFIQPFVLRPGVQTPYQPGHTGPLSPSWKAAPRADWERPHESWASVSIPALALTGIFLLARPACAFWQPCYTAGLNWANQNCKVKSPGLHPMHRRWVFGSEMSPPTLPPSFASLQSQSLSAGLLPTSTSPHTMWKNIILPLTPETSASCS